MDLDLDNLPNPDQFKLENYPGIKPEAIVEMFNAGRLDWLLSFFDFQARAKSRAESLALVYFHQMEVYKRKLDEFRNGGVIPIAPTRARAETRKEPQEAPKVELLDL